MGCTLLAFAGTGGGRYVYGAVVGPIATAFCASLEFHCALTIVAQKVIFMVILQSVLGKYATGWPMPLIHERLTSRNWLGSITQVLMSTVLHGLCALEGPLDLPRFRE